MVRFKTRVAVLVTAVSVATLGLSVPARADSVFGSCDTDIRFWINVRAFAVVENGGGTHRWTHLEGSLNGSAGDKSNVNAWFYQQSDGVDVLRGTYRSPDNVHGGPFNLPVVPNPTTYALTGEFVDFEAVFDKFGPDPRCTDRSDII